MPRNKAYPVSAQQVLGDFMQLTKFRLSISIIFSSVAGYLLAAETVEFKTLILLVGGGYAVVGASNAFNQWIEKEQDGLMSRTKNRPLPAGRMSDSTALCMAFFLAVSGLLALYFVNAKTAFFAGLSIVIYTCVYTPLKRKTPLAVFIGAIPGAIPFMLGWVGATNHFGIEIGVLFMIQFFWQFPHFWAIGWVLDEDYKKAGFKMLPSGKTDQATAFQIVFYTLWMILTSLIPILGYSGVLYLSKPAAMAVVAIGLFMLYFSIDLMKKKTKTAAKRLIFASIVYITLLQSVYVIDKFI